VFIHLSQMFSTTGLRHVAVYKRSRALLREFICWLTYFFFKLIYLEEMAWSYTVGEVRELGVVGRILLKLFLKSVGREGVD